jgi:hypothetical protein
MRARCEVPTRDRYEIYGGRGIRVCDRWKDFSNFLADMGERPEGCTIDRIDPDGNYEPSNCRWATAHDQQRHLRRVKQLTFRGVTKPLPAWCDEFQLSRELVGWRVRRGWSVEDALLTPAVKGNRVKRAA